VSAAVPGVAPAQRPARARHFFIFSKGLNDEGPLSFSGWFSCSSPSFAKRTTHTPPSSPQILKLPLAEGLDARVFEQGGSVG